MDQNLNKNKSLKKPTFSRHFSSPNSSASSFKFIGSLLILSSFFLFIGCSKDEGHSNKSTPPPPPPAENGEIPVPPIPGSPDLEGRTGGIGQNPSASKNYWIYVEQDKDSRTSILRCNVPTLLIENNSLTEFKSMDSAIQINLGRRTPNVQAIPVSACKMIPINPNDRLKSFQLLPNLDQLRTSKNDKYENIGCYRNSPQGSTNMSLTIVHPQKLQLEYRDEYQNIQFKDSFKWISEKDWLDLKQDCAPSQRKNI